MIEYYKWMSGGPNKQKLTFGSSTDIYVECYIFGENIIPRPIRKDMIIEFAESISEEEYIDLMVSHFSMLSCKQNNSHSNEIEKEKEND